MKGSQFRFLCLSVSILYSGIIYSTWAKDVDDLTGVTLHQTRSATGQAFAHQFSLARLRQYPFSSAILTLKERPFSTKGYVIDVYENQKILYTVPLTMYTKPNVAQIHQVLLHVENQLMQRQFSLLLSEDNQ